MSNKIESLESGKGVQVVTPGPDHSFNLNEDALSELLLRDDIKDRPVVVISVAGAFRKGKSFLLDFFLRYMHHKYNLSSGGDWMGGDQEELSGFSWRGGSERDTTGLLLWSQPFKVTLPSGEKVVVLLMDTQGTFDSESTVKDNATVFALSTMLSSVQIYNLSQNIEEDDLQHLQLFTDYGRLASKSSSGAAFQRLQFLVRDWSFPYEHPYGARGGQQLLKKRLEVHEGQHEELQSLRRYVSGCFSDLDCFLLPHPGLSVATNPHFKGNLTDISPEFQTSLRELVTEVLEPSRLVPKTIEGQQVKAKELLLYFKAYLQIFNGKELPEPKTILEATAEANNLSAVAAAREVYDVIMEGVCGGRQSYLQPALLRSEHERARDKALHAFSSRRKMGGAGLADGYRGRLCQELEEQFKQLSAHNEGKNIFNFAGTPLVLLVVMLAGYMLSVLGNGVGVQTISAVGQMSAITAAALLAMWAYSRVSGNIRDVGQQIDNVASQIKVFVMSQALETMIRREAPEAISYSDKKTS